MQMNGWKNKGNDIHSCPKTYFFSFFRVFTGMRSRCETDTLNQCFPTLYKPLFARF